MGRTVDEVTEGAENMIGSKSLNPPLWRS